MHWIMYIVNITGMIGDRRLTKELVVNVSKE